jgi:Fe-S-cluster containining protein
MGGGSSSRNPCLGCGACCAFFRVQFYWREANEGDGDHVVPPGYFEELTDFHRCMMGTSEKHHPKCRGLGGRIGKDAACTIYSARPTPCRQFQASYSNGRHNPRCDEARRAHGLKPLRRQDWSEVGG